MARRETPIFNILYRKKKKKLNFSFLIRKENYWPNEINSIGIFENNAVIIENLFI